MPPVAKTLTEAVPESAAMEIKSGEFTQHIAAGPLYKSFWKTAIVV